MDEQDRPVPAGEVGELLVRTPTMMQGYWNRPDLNERAFFYRPSAGGRQDVFYRTGDLVRLAADGNYRFLGRKDRQIKSRGYRVELAEVEAALLTHPQVEAAAVFPVPDSEGTHHIQAAIIGQGGAPVAPAALTRYLSTRLPRYAIPTRITVRSEFPRTGSGKIDRQALQAEVVNQPARISGHG